MILITSLQCSKHSKFCCQTLNPGFHVDTTGHKPPAPNTLENLAPAHPDDSGYISRTVHAATPQKLHWNCQERDKELSVSMWPQKPEIFD